MEHGHTYTELDELREANFASQIRFEWTLEDAGTSTPENNKDSGYYFFIHLNNQHLSLVLCHHEEGKDHRIGVFHDDEFELERLMLQSVEEQGGNIGQNGWYSINDSLREYLKAKLN